MLDTIENKIIEGLKKTSQVPDFVSFGTFMTTLLTDDELLYLTQRSKREGPDKNRKWFCEVLTRSGRYEITNNRLERKD